MAIRGARKRQSSAEDLNPRNGKRVAHGRPISPGTHRLAISAAEADSTGSGSGLTDSQGFYDSIVVRLP